MPRDSTETKARLLRAAERVFAHDGVHAAQMRDVVRLAGQANDSAVQYHFGSRDGLLQAIAAAHIAAMEPARREWLARLGPQPALPDVVAAIVRPTLSRLESPSGRDFLLITAQLAGLAGIGTPRQAGPLTATALLAQLDALRALLAARLAQPFVVARVAAMVALLTATLADRARLLGRPAARRRDALGPDEFAADLEAMLVALLSAPPGSMGW